MQSDCEHFHIGIIAEIEDSPSIRIPKVSHEGCVAASCLSHGCRKAVLLSGERLSHFTTARVGYITPHHTWESVCFCKGTSVCHSLCVFMSFREPDIRVGTDVRLCDTKWKLNGAGMQMQKFTKQSLAPITLKI